MNPTIFPLLMTAQIMSATIVYGYVSRLALYQMTGK